MLCNVIKITKAPKNWEDDPSYVFIGRPSPLKNPFPIEAPYGPVQRAESIRKFRKYFEEKLYTDKDFCDMIKSLYGKTLVCFCKPLACHGDVIAEYVEKLNNDRAVQSGRVHLWTFTEG